MVARTLWPLLNSLFVLPTNRFRKRVGAPLVKDLADMMSKRMVLLPVSRHVAPPDPRWPAAVCQTGYWFARPVAGWAPPQDLLDFLQRGEKPIAVSLGVMSKSGQQAQQGAQIVLEAVRRAGTRAIIQGWDEALQGVTLPESIYHAGSLPHGWLFAQVSAVIHHGGFGTTAAVLRSGMPGIVVPHVIDQFYWGQRVQELGVGPKCITRASLKAENLSAAITQAMSDSTIRTAATALGQKICAEEDGVTAAVRTIQSLSALFEHPTPTI